MKVLVCGGRNYFDRARVRLVLDAYHALEPITLLIHGAAHGADSLAAAWATERGIPTDPHPAQWDDLSHPDARIKRRRSGAAYDANAGFRRNQEMADLRPDLVIAFKGGNGTADMVERARGAGLTVREVKEAPFG